MDSTESTGTASTETARDAREASDGASSAPALEQAISDELIQNQRSRAARAPSRDGRAG
jgi:hypothetical protein